MTHSKIRHLALLLAMAAAMVGVEPRAVAQAPGTAPVSVSHETQVLHGRKYYVHIVEKGQTVYSISRAYKVQAYDAVTHQDIHFLHPGDTVWLPCRGQFSEPAQELSQPAAQERKPAQPEARPVQSAKTAPAAGAQPAKAAPGQVLPPPEARKVGKVLRVSLMMPLYLNQIDEISTSKFDVEQRGKKTYKQFEFIEFYEGILVALDELSADGVSVELNVVDVTDGTADGVSAAFASHNVAQSDFVIALLLRDAFGHAADLARQAGVYIVNPMSSRSEILADNPYVVKTQPAVEGQVAAMLSGIRAEQPSSHIYIVHSGSKAEKAYMDELKRQLAAQADMPYTLFNWSQSAKLASTLKQTPSAAVVSIYDQGRDQNRLYTQSLLNRLASLKSGTPVLYTFSDWTRDFADVDFAQLQQLSYHTFYTSWDMTNAVHVDFLKAFRTRFGTEPTSPLAATGHDIMLYLCTGLHKIKGGMWMKPIRTLPSLTQPIQLSRTQAGLENTLSQLYRLSDLHFVPVGQQ